jgi:anthranilate synthase/aminodeoxychorismate synthase-like glutamine amidotransferase
MTLSVLFIDNFDSFTFNLVDEFRKRGANVVVWRNDTPVGKILELAADLPLPRMIAISPGPGSPAEAGCCIDLVRKTAGRFPLFGVCLGHQAMIEAFGGEVGPASEIVHGKADLIEHSGEELFSGLPKPLTVGRYHSLVGRLLPGCLQVAATIPARSGRPELVMAVRHREFPLWGVQFHPESILTTQGGMIMNNLVGWASAWNPSQSGPGERQS